jgi:hypothetical protein
VIRWIFATLAAGLLVVAGAVAVRRLLGRPDTRPSVLTPVVAQWLGAYVLWTFTGGLLVRSGVLSAYDGPYFLILALAGGIGQYRALRAGGREPALAIFVGGQILWLLVVLLRNGLLPSL